VGNYQNPTDDSRQCAPKACSVRQAFENGSYCQMPGDTTPCYYKKRLRTELNTSPECLVQCPVNYDGVLSQSIYFCEPKACRNRTPSGTTLCTLPGDTTACHQSFSACVDLCPSNYHGVADQDGYKCVINECENRSGAEACYNSEDQSVCHSLSTPGGSKCYLSCPSHTTADDFNHECTVNACSSRKPDKYGLCSVYTGEACYPLPDGSGCKDSTCPPFSEVSRGVCYAIECTRRFENVSVVFVIGFCFLLELQRKGMRVAWILKRIACMMANRGALYLLFV
jgi:hypothetical protein